LTTEIPTPIYDGSESQGRTFHYRGLFNSNRERAMYVFKYVSMTSLIRKVSIYNFFVPSIKIFKYPRMGDFTEIRSKIAFIEICLGTFGIIFSGCFRK